jgi:hypothetical protein
MEHKVLMRLHGGAQRGVVVLARGWPKLETRWGAHKRSGRKVVRLW